VYSSGLVSVTTRPLLLTLAIVAVSSCVVAYSVGVSTTSSPARQSTAAARTRDVSPALADCGGSNSSGKRQ
jgi:hypothetical protein